MRLSLITEHRFSRTPDGNVWTATANAYSFWARYLSVFDEVNVTARVLDGPIARADGEHHRVQWTRADGPGVRFSAVPYYVGPYRYALRWPLIRRALRNAVRADDAVLMRVPSFLANCIEPVLRRRRQPFGLEVVGDPHDGLAPGGIRHLLRPLLRIRVPRQLREQCWNAAGVAYVTKSALQQRYPSPALMVGVSDAVIPITAIAGAKTVFTTHYSSLSLAPGMVSAPRTVVREGAVRVVCVGSLEQFYKGHDVLVRAVARCVAEGLDLHLTLVGEGRIRSSIEALATELRIRSRCTFLGQLGEGAPVLRELDQSDIFVLASRTEGLPRAVIEAMARGLPCISTTVGGIPELLPPEDLVPPDNVAALALKIREVVESVSRREQMSRRNVSVACQYVDDVLQVRRTEFYRHIRAVTATAVEARSSRS
jgi:glycosyltransferase involved in cell wall biosynthesis